MAVPLVSILVPSFNHGRFLRMGIEGVRGQTVSDWELIVVDDRSRDESVAIGREFAALDSRIRVSVNERNLGTYGTLERARNQARGRFIAVLNSDDVWAPDKLERQVARLEAHPKIPLCYTLGWKIDEQGGVDEAEDVHAGWPTEPLQELLPRLLYQNRILASSVLYRWDAVRFDPSLRYSGDWVALLNCARHTAVACVAERLTYWRMHESNSFVRSEAQVNEEVRVRTAILQRPARWLVTRLPERELREGLGMNALALAALEMLRGERRAAIAAALAGVRWLPDKGAALRRLAACIAPGGRERLWPGDTTEFEDVPAPLPVTFR